MASCKTWCRLFLMYFLVSIQSPVVGYQAILPILLKEGIFSNLCETFDALHGCPDQLLRLNWMYNLTVAMINVTGVIWGPLSAKLGARNTSALGGILITIGCVLLSFGWNWGVFFGYIIIGMSGLANIFASLGTILTEFDPSMIPFLLGLWVGAIDLSCGVFYLFSYVYDAGISFQAIFIGFATIVFVLTIFAITFIYNKNIFSAEKPIQTETQVRRGSIHDRRGSMVHVETKMSINAVDDGGDHYVPMDQLNEQVEADKACMTFQADTPWYKTYTFFIIVVWASMYMMVKYFYIQTVNLQLMWIDNTDDKTTKYVRDGQEIISIMLLAGGLFTFISGPMISKFGIRWNIIFMAILSLITGIISVIKVTWLQYITMILMVFLRFIFFAIIQMVIGGCFGQGKTPQIFGIVLCLAGVFTLSGYLCNWVIVKYAHGSFLYFNIIAGILCCVSGIALVINMYAQHSQIN